MGWIQEKFERRAHSDHGNANAQNTAEISFEAVADQKWRELVADLKRDVDEYRSLGGDVILREDSDLACRITNPKPGVTALIIADLGAHTVQYTFESEAGRQPFQKAVSFRFVAPRLTEPISIQQINESARSRQDG